VISALSDTQRALTPTEVYDLAREHYPPLGLVSVYRTLETLGELGLIQRVHQPEGCAAYLSAFSGHQHLLICQDCGRTVFFDGDDLKALMSRVEHESGYRVNEHWLQLFGLCVQCQGSDDNEHV
jgi:Fe2+ or Zn2+ uptake regulation protein